MNRKAGRPVGGKLSDEEKKLSLLRARELQKQWRIDNPERYAEHIKKYRESRKVAKEVDQFDLIQKFVKRIKTVNINGLSAIRQPCQCS